MGFIDCQHFVSTNSKCKNKKKRSQVCSMALVGDDKVDDNDSSSDEVTPKKAEILEMLEENSKALKARIRCWRRLARS